MIYLPFSKNMYHNDFDIQIKKKNLLDLTKDSKQLDIISINKNFYLKDGYLWYKNSEVMFVSYYDYDKIFIYDENLLGLTNRIYNEIMLVSSTTMIRSEKVKNTELGLLINDKFLYSPKYKKLFKKLQNGDYFRYNKVDNDCMILFSETNKLKRFKKQQDDSLTLTYANEYIVYEKKYLLLDSGNYLFNLNSGTSLELLKTYYSHRSSKFLLFKLNTRKKILLLTDLSNYNLLDYIILNSKYKIYTKTRSKYPTFITDEKKIVMKIKDNKILVKEN